MINDPELLEQYVRQKSEEAFTALVERHLNLVYSAALRQIRSRQLAEEVVQSVFMDLARQAQQLAPKTILSAWLYQVTRRTAINVIRREARRQMREQIASELTAMNATTSDWRDVEGLLDEAMDALDETDRTAVLLRYFENKSLREVGHVLGASDNAAQKRVVRAVERLREFFAKRGIAIGASGLVVAISANAVQAAPIGLAATMSSAAFVSSAATITASATATITKAITMTTLQKTCIAASLIVAAGTGIHLQMHKVLPLQKQVSDLRKRQAPLVEQIEQLQRERDEATRQLAVLRADNDRLSQNSSELLKLRNEVATLRRGQGAAVPAGAPPAAATTDNGPSPVDMGKDLGLAVVRGEQGAFGKLLDLARTQLAAFNTNRVGLTDSARGELASRTFAPLYAAFKVIEEAALAGSPTASDAVVQSLQIPELKGNAVQCLGSLAGSGNETALEILLNPQRYNLLQSTVVSALRPAADTGNQKAIDYLAGVANDSTHTALWYMAAKGLEKSAGSGNIVAIDALVALSASRNASVQNAVIPGLTAAAANQNAKAAEALRSIDSLRKIQ
jgi:RNA polymerase sigma factor (sigma-70 family)